MWCWSNLVSNIPKPEHLLNLDLDWEFRLPPPLSIINTEYWTAVKLDLLAEIENILFSIKHLLYKYKLIFSFYRRFLTFSENSKKVSTLFVILKIFVKFQSVYIWQVDIGNTILNSDLDKITWYFKHFPHRKSLMKNSKVHNYVTWRPEGGSGLTFRKIYHFNVSWNRVKVQYLFRKKLICKPCIFLFLLDRMSIADFLLLSS